MNVEVVDGPPRGGSGGGATLVVMLVVALLLGALAWWFLGPDDDDKPPAEVEFESDPALTLRARTVTTSDVTVGWTFVGNDATYGEYSLRISAGGSQIARADPSPASSSHTFSGLSSNSLYTIAMTVVTDLGNVYAEITVTTLPQPPSIISADAGETSVTLQWDHTESGGFTYNVSHRRTDDPQLTWVTSPDLAAQNVVEKSFEVTSLLSNTAYEFKITATAQGGHTADSTIFSKTTLRVWPLCTLSMTVTECSPTAETCRVFECSKEVSNDPSAGTYYVTFNAKKPYHLDDGTDVYYIPWPESNNSLTVRFDEAFTDYILVSCQILYEIGRVKEYVGNIINIVPQAQPSQADFDVEELYLSHDAAVIEWTLETDLTGMAYLIEGVTCDLSDDVRSHTSLGLVEPGGKKARCINTQHHGSWPLTPETWYTMRAGIQLSNHAPNEKIDVQHSFRTQSPPAASETTTYEDE